MAARTPSGPTSRKRTAPAARRPRTASWNRTASRTCRTQWPGEQASSAVSGRPVSAETTGTTGALRSRPATTVRNRSSIGSISGEWNACDTRRRRVRPPSAASSAAASSTASSAPDSTSERGPLTAARLRRSPSSGRTRSSSASTATIAPPSGSASIRSPRAATRAAASGSDSTPARCAAVISPSEWPASRSGATPQESSSAASATSTANSAGCAYRVRSRTSCGPVSTRSRSGRSRRRSNSAHTASNASAYAGWAAYRSAPMPARCAPWPVHRNAVRPPRTATGRASASSARISPASVPAAATRYSNAVRVVASERATATGSACAAACERRRSTWARTASGDRPDSTHGTTPPSPSTGAAVSSAGGACSRIRCALVPLTPNDETPARRGAPVSGHGVVSVRTETAPRSSRPVWRGGRRAGSRAACRAAATARS